MPTCISEHGRCEGTICCEREFNTGFVLEYVQKMFQVLDLRYYMLITRNKIFLFYFICFISNLILLFEVFDSYFVFPFLVHLLSNRLNVHTYLLLLTSTTVGNPYLLLIPHLPPECVQLPSPSGRVFAENGGDGVPSLPGLLSTRGRFLF